MEETISLGKITTAGLHSEHIWDTDFTLTPISGQTFEHKKNIVPDAKGPPIILWVFIRQQEPTSCRQNLRVI